MTLPEGTVTLLFTDVEGSTDLRTREGDDVAQELLRAHERLLRERVEAHAGQEVAFMGDGFLIAFGSTRKALACAVDIQRTFEEHNQQHPERPIKVRAGLNTGEVLQEGGTLYGTAVHAAARIMGKADGGQICVSQIVKDLTAGVRDFRFADRGLHELKGFPDKWRVYEVLWREEPADERAAIEERPRAAPPLVAQAIEGATPPPAFELVGRAEEKSAIEAELGLAAGGRIRVLSLEGEAGIGKTRLLEEAVQIARERGFGVVTVGGDEELRGPFLLLRTLLASSALQALAEAGPARDALQDARQVLAGGGTRDGEGLSASEQMLQVYDVASQAIRTIAAERPLAMLLDDLQWADEDSIKLIRYLVRTAPTTPLFLVLSIRWEVEPTHTAANTLVADLERMQLAHRHRLERFSRADTAALLEQVLGAPVGPDAVSTLHRRGEGVPFFVVEFARAYREARLLQLVRGTWKISRTARQTVPTSVQILIERRLAQLPDDSKAALADAAIIGRRVRVEDVAEVCGRAEGKERDPGAIAELLEPGVAHSLIVPDGPDFVFTHEQIRSVLAGTVTRERRRALHAALVEVLAARAGLDLDGPVDAAAPAALATIAHHALEAGESDRGIRLSIAAARAALGAHAPEEAIRLVDEARPAASAPEHRADLLRIRDDALAVLGRGAERPPILAELAALATALGDPSVELEVTLRRASAARLTGDLDQAVELARDARSAAADRGEREMELEAAFELGQALLRAPLGEAFMPDVTVSDLDGAEEAFRRAADLAEILGEERRLAVATRELGVVSNGRAAQRMLELIAEERQLEASEDPEIRTHLGRAKELIGEAVATCERTGDKRTEMSSLIALTYAHVLDDTQHGHAGRIEQIRRLRQRLSRLTSETERATSELHMLYSILLYAVLHGHIDLALARGGEAYGQARAHGERRFEFLAAGALVEAHLQLGEQAEAEAWLGRAEEAALASSLPLLDRQLEIWRGMVRAAHADLEGVREHYERAVALAADAGSPAGRCEAFAQLALKLAHLTGSEGDDGPLEEVERAADEALRIADALPGAAPWAAKAHAARALVARARGDGKGSIDSARRALAAEHEGRHLFKVMDLDLWVAVATALADEKDPQAEGFRHEVGLLLLVASISIADEPLRERWLAGPRQARLLELIGGLPDPPFDIGELGAGRPPLGEQEAEALRRITAGDTAAEIGADLGLDEGEVEALLQKVFDKLGARGVDEAAEQAVRMGVS